MVMQQRMPDEWLMREVAHGHREHLEALVQRYATPLMRFVSRMVTDRHRSEELIQETFLAVWKHRDQYSSVLRFRPWLYQIAANKCREAHRRRGPHVVVIVESLDDPSVVAQQPGPAESAVATESAIMVLEAIACLPDQQRAVLVMRFWNERPFQEIARALGCSTSTARSHLYHALATMRRRARHHKRVAAADGNFRAEGIEGCFDMITIGRGGRNDPDIERQCAALNGHCWPSLDRNSL